MILVVTGGRKHPWDAKDGAIVIHLFDYMGVTDVWHGGAVGVDERVKHLARCHGIGTREFMPDPALFPEDRKIALMKRNETMIDALVLAISEGHHGCVLAFPGGAGTNGACAYALRKKLHIIDFRGRARGGDGP